MGHARRGGIEVQGVSKLLGFSAFEAHAGSKLHRPCENTFAPDGHSLQVSLVSTGCLHVLGGLGDSDSGRGSTKM